jgi:TetR/AcrR family transcriptional regulator, cholesterol catabolism regulator
VPVRRSPEARANDILTVVIDLLDNEGHEAVQLRAVAARARVSLATIYELFGTRDQLIVAAVQSWLDVNAYEVLTAHEPGESPYETLVRVLRTVFEPWERHPNMLRAYHRARTGPGGDELVMHGLSIVKPIAEAAIDGTDPRYLDDVRLIFGHVVRAVIARFTEGEISISEVLPILERTLFRLTTDNQLGPARSRPRAVGSQRSRASKARASTPGRRRHSA